MTGRSGQELDGVQELDYCDVLMYIYAYRGRSFITTVYQLKTHSQQSLCLLRTLTKPTGFCF